MENRKNNENDNARSSAVKIKQAEDSLYKSEQLVLKIGERSKEVGQIVNAILNLTSVLVFNKTMGRTNAGKEEKNITTIADQISSLITQSQQASKQIIQFITEICNETNQVMVLIQNDLAATRYNGGCDNVTGTAFFAIAVRMNGLSMNLEKISADVDFFTKVSNQNAAIVKMVKEFTPRHSDVSITDDHYGCKTIYCENNKMH